MNSNCILYTALLVVLSVGKAVPEMWVQVIIVRCLG